MDIASRQVGSIGNISNTSLSHQNGAPGALEGWRAILTVVLRYGMAQRQRIEYNFLAQGHPPPEKADEQTSMDVDVKAMVAGVKSRGVSFIIYSLLISLIWVTRERICSDTCEDSWGSQ